MQTVETPRLGITATFDRHGGTITSTHLQSDADSPEWKAVIDGVLGVVLGHACAGLDISNSTYLDGIENALNRLADKYGL